jgi:hypothetical protein
LAGKLPDGSFTVYLVKDVWRNVSLARNYGALLAEVGGADRLIFLDDDAIVPAEFIQQMARLVSDNRPVDMSATLCFAITTQDFFKVGGFDLRYKPMHQEDIELFLRCEKSGMKILKLPTPEGHIHYASPSQVKILQHQWNSTFTWMRYRVIPHTSSETIAPPIGNPWLFLKFFFVFLFKPRQSKFMFVRLPAFFYWLIYKQISKDCNFIEATKRLIGSEYYVQKKYRDPDMKNYRPQTK